MARPKDSFFDTYIKNQTITNHKDCSAIIHEYGLELSEQLKKGYKYKELLGTVCIVKKDVASKKPTILSGQTKRLRDATGDTTVKVYRTNTEYYSIHWTLAVLYKILLVKFTKYNERSIDKYKDELELNVQSVTPHKNGVKNINFVFKK